ncbi:MAG: DUF58 domain-containing protein [Nevskiaceae bacterium]|nr:MAG: DUF58 domain-containing protein [Nevskiaceae bacterium]TBR74678.1 MAG: DUF58 domain-containing protein [Nevskiaceae bacterium]
MLAKGLKTRFERWLRHRLPRQPGPVVLSRRRLFILPTRFGYGYVVLIVLMVLGATNYANSMAFALAFLLAGIGLVAMYHTHANLARLEVDVTPPQPGFAGQKLHFALRLKNASQRPRYALRAGFTEASEGRAVDVPAHSSAHVALHVPAPQRGWLELPRFTISSEFPLGLFHAWAWVELDTRALVCPAPAGNALFPIGGGTRSGTRATTGFGMDEFAGLRAYRVGDPIRAVHWKSLARQADPLVKEFAAHIGGELWLTWDTLPGLETEARLSQLTRWLLAADARHQPYGLQLPGFSRAPALGNTHRRACLQALALYGLPDQP